MTKVIEWAKGKKSYGVALGGVLTIGAFSLGLIEKGMAESILALLGFTGVATLGAKINRSGAK